MQPVGFDNKAHIKKLEGEFKRQIKRDNVEDPPYYYVQMTVCEGRGAGEFVDVVSASIAITTKHNTNLSV